MSKNQGEGLKHKLKTLLGLKKTHTIPTIGSDNEEEQEYVFTVDKLKELNRENNVNHRARVLKELCEIVASRKLEEHAAEAVWNEIGDMLQASTPTEPRQSALKFLACLAAGQAQRLGILRAQFLRLIENHAVKEDLSYRIDLLIALTDNGKNVSYCENIGPFLLQFTTEVLAGDRTEKFLMFLINLVHYNSSFLDKEIIVGLVERTCAFCNKAKAENEIESCLHLLDATVRYSGLPSDGLYPIIATLCRTVNIEQFCQASWKLMKILVGTRLGHSAIYIMCCILEDENNMTDSILLRGAVFFIGMCIWGSKRVTTLQHRPISLLPSFKQALHCNHPIVAHEISLSLQRLVKKYGSDLQIVTWDIILDLIDMLIKLHQNLSSVNESLKMTIHDLLTTIEELYIAGKFDGSAERFFAIIERCSSQRPDSSVLTLLTFIHEGIHPSNDGWLDTLKHIMEKYFRKETRTEIRVKMLDILSAVLTSYRFWFEEELIELAVLSYLNDIDKEKDANVRLVAAQLLVDLISTFTSSKCLEILAILKKLINRLMDSTGTSKEANNDQLLKDGEHLRDIKIAVDGLIETFKQKLVESQTIMAIMILEILVEHISFHYINGFTAKTGADARIEIFKLFLSIRADERHRIGVLQTEVGEDCEIRYSVFATCKQIKARDHNPLGRKSSLTKYCPTYKTFEAVLYCLKDEWEWIVLQYVLLQLPSQLRNKTLILGGGADVANLCTSLCSMVNNGQFLNKVKNVPAGSGRTDLLNLVFPILAVLVTYNDTIEKPRQIELVKSLELGLNSHCARLCVICLTVCILEMKAVMLRTLPSILIKLSKISATVPMSIPMLEFLSSLKEITELYSNFVEEQYMSIFAIALPYTDAHRYSEYTVTLAHYVIASWFTRCRLSFRKGFVRLITKGLQSSAIMKPPQANDKQTANSKASTMAETHEFHEDMTEVCLDMMARYSFSMISNQPKRSPVADFLLSNGLSQSWLVGNTLVTVTTSGSSSNECPLCIQKKTKQAATKAAAKSRLLNVNADKMIENGSELPLSKAIDVIDAKINFLEESTNEATEKVDIASKQQEPSTLKDDVNETSFPSKEQLLTERESLSECKAIDNEASISFDQRKNSRVDSAVEMMEDLEVPSKLIDDVIEEEATSSKVVEVSDKATNQNDLEFAVAESSHEEDIDVSLDISLVDRLALQQQHVNKIFSPTSYFLNELSSLAEAETSATSSIEIDRDDQNGSKLSDVQKNIVKEKSNKELFDMEKSFEQDARDKGASGKHSPDLESSDFGKAVTMHSLQLGIKEESNNLLKRNSGSILNSDEKDILDKADSSDKAFITDPMEKISAPRDESLRVAGQTQQYNAVEYSGRLKQNFLRSQQTPDTTSADSSAQTSPFVSKKASFATSIELSSEYEMIETEDARSFEVRRDLGMKPTIEAVCCCSSDSWAEMLIRRPTGNTSWTMRLDNVLESEGRDYGGIEDIASLVAAMELEDFGHDFRDVREPKMDDKMQSRPRFLSTVTDELSRERQSNRSSSDSLSLFNEISNSSPNMVRRRRFSTGSMDLPGAFTFSLPSPDPNKERDEVSDGSFSVKYHFDKPSLGFSPLSSLKRSGSTNSISDIKDKATFSLNDLVLASSYKSDIRSTFDASGSNIIQGNAIISESSNKTSQQRKKKLTKTMSSPTSGPTTSDSAKSDATKLDFDLPHSQRLGSMLAESISKIYELNSRQTEGTEKDCRDIPSSSARVTKSFAGSLKVAKAFQAKGSYQDNQADAMRKSTNVTEEGKLSINHNTEELVKTQGLKANALSFKEPRRTGPKALKDRISSFSGYRPRGKTISAYPVARSSHDENNVAVPDRNVNTLLNPYFVFLQFFYSPFISAGGNARPLLLRSGEVIDRAVKMLDRLPPYNHHKIGVIYVGPGQQKHETSILANQYGSSRYVNFLQGIGKLISLLECSQAEVYTGGLDRNGADGKFAYSWRDSITQVIFHVATLMPNKSSDTACNSKKLHIGNNFVTIVYNDSNKPYEFGTIKGQFNFAEVVIKPLDYSSNLVSVRMKEELGNVVTNTGPHVISDLNLPILVRQLAVHTNMATVLHYSKNKPSDAYGCNWLERLKQIKRIRSKAIIANQGPVITSNLVTAKGVNAKQIESLNSDFTDYT